MDGRFDVICTGSFLGVKGFREPYVRGVPVGYEEQLTMYPLTFKEFLINTRMDEKVYDYVNKSLSNKTMVEQTVHDSMRSLYLQFLIVCGMPEVVLKFFETHDLNQVREIQKRILESIKDDFGRYKDKNGHDAVNEVLKLRAEACLNSLPAQLFKEYKKFQYSLVDVKGHSPEKADGLQYLEDVGLVVRAYNTKALSFPMEAEKIPTEFKVFYIDTGLLISQLDEEAAESLLALWRVFSSEVQLIRRAKVPANKAAVITIGRMPSARAVMQGIQNVKISLLFSSRLLEASVRV